jgi:hypothetical protein
VNWFAYVLIIIGGFLVGGVISLWRNDSRIAAGVVGVLAVLCVGGGVLWLV